MAREKMLYLAADVCAVSVGRFGSIGVSRSVPVDPGGLGTETSL